MEKARPGRAGGVPHRPAGRVGAADRARIALLETAAPSHVEAVRRNFVEAVSEEDYAALGPGLPAVLAVGARLRLFGAPTGEQIRDPPAWSPRLDAIMTTTVDAGIADLAFQLRRRGLGHVLDTHDPGPGAVLHRRLALPRRASGGRPAPDGRGGRDRAGGRPRSSASPSPPVEPARRAPATRWAPGWSGYVPAPERRSRRSTRRPAVPRRSSRGWSRPRCRPRPLRTGCGSGPIRPPTPAAPSAG